MEESILSNSDYQMRCPAAGSRLHALSTAENME